MMTLCTNHFEIRKMKEQKAVLVLMWLFTSSKKLIAVKKVILKSDGCNVSKWYFLQKGVYVSERKLSKTPSRISRGN